MLVSITIIKLINNLIRDITVQLKTVF